MPGARVRILAAYLGAWPGMLARNRAGGQVGGCASVERDRWGSLVASLGLHALWPGAAGTANVQLGRADSWLKFDRTEVAGWRHARGVGVSLVAAFRLGGIAERSGRPHDFRAEAKGPVS